MIRLHKKATTDFYFLPGTPHMLYKENIRITIISCPSLLLLGIIAVTVVGTVATAVMSKAAKLP
jgi:hypothetical protein